MRTFFIILASLVLTRVDYVKGKLIVKTSISIREGVLQLIHTNICGSITHVALRGYRYFITFIDDFFAIWMDLFVA